MRLRALAVGAVLAVAAGCGASAEEPRDDPSVAAELLQYRRDEALHQLQVKLANAGDRAVTVDRFELDLPGFEAVPAGEPGSRLDPGRRVDLPLVYGAARCASGAPADRTAGDPALRVWLDGADEPVEVEPADPRDMLGRLVTGECAQRAVTDAVPLAFTDAWAPVGAGDTLVVTGALRVGPTGEQARLDMLNGTTLFGITTTTRLPIELGEQVDVPVTVAPQRCDPHAVAEIKRFYAFRVGVSLDGAEPVLVMVEVGPAQRPVLEAALLERCGLG